MTYNLLRDTSGLCRITRAEFPLGSSDAYGKSAGVSKYSSSRAVREAGEHQILPLST
jgi:hypothetical protein